MLALSGLCAAIRRRFASKAASLSSHSKTRAVSRKRACWLLASPSGLLLRSMVMAPPVGYVAYIDEAGDTGLKNIRVPGRSGASEWLVLSAVLVRAEREQELEGWTRQLIASLDQHQVRQLHFRQLPEHRKSSVCRQLASMDVRLFVLISHKRNMQGYQNINAQRAGVNKTAWFYAWCSKLLMESITDYCGRRSRKEHNEPRIVRCEFSQTGGVKLNDLRAYYKYIKDQAALGLSFNKDFPLDWEVVDHAEMFIYPNTARYGLQLADVLASAFYAGLEYPETGKVNADYAKLLLPRICQDRRRTKYMYGVKVLPRTVALNLPPDQRALFDFYADK